MYGKILKNSEMAGNGQAIKKDRMINKKGPDGHPDQLQGGRRMGIRFCSRR